MLAIRSGSVIDVLSDTPLSRAGSLLQGNCVLLAFEDLVHDPVGLQGLFGDGGVL